MDELYLSDKPVVLMCIKNSYSCNTGSVIGYNYGNIQILCGQRCLTKQLDFGSSYLKWVGIFIDNKYYGAHLAKNFINLAIFRDNRIDQILE